MPTVTLERQSPRHLARRRRTTNSEGTTSPAKTGRQILLELYEAAVRGAAPGPATAAAVDALAVPNDRRVWLFAIGKAGLSMAAAASERLDRSHHALAGGLVVSLDESPSPHSNVVVLAGDHPVSGSRSFAAATALGEIASRRHEDDVVIVLLSGGASALIGAPLPGMSAADLVHLHEI